MYKIAQIVVFFALVQSSQAALMLFNADESVDNASARASWITAIGGGSPQHLVDFESGFVDGQNIHGMSFAGGLVISDTGGGTPTVEIEGTAGGIGGSNPVGNFSARHDEQAYLVFDFTLSPVDYVGFLDIDHAGTTVVITFEGGATQSINLDDTSASGDSAEFTGIYRNDQPKIVKLEMNATGDRKWAVDNVEYGKIPEPSSTALLGLGGLALMLSRRK